MMQAGKDDKEDMDLDDLGRIRSHTDRMIVTDHFEEGEEDDSDLDDGDKEAQDKNDVVRAFVQDGELIAPSPISRWKCVCGICFTSCPQLLLTDVSVAG